MKIVLITVGITNKKYLSEGINEYQNRLNHYTNFEIIQIPNLKNTGKLSKEELMKQEGTLILSKVQRQTDYLVLLEERGQHYTSISFSQRIQKWMISGKKRIFFVIGGAYGFSEEVYNRGNEKLSLSKMTFSHQMVRLFFVEQLYRSYTILNNEPYHHK